MKTSFLYTLRIFSFLFLLHPDNTFAQTDTIAPVISLIGPDTVRIELGANYTDQGATAYDNQEGDISAMLIMTTNLDVNLPGIYTLTYNVKDSSENDAKPAIRIIIVLNDQTKPVISLNPANPGCIELNCNNPPFIDPGATATDNRPPFNLTSSILVSGTVDTRKIGIYTLTYNVQDVSGNKAIEQTRNVCVETTKPHGFQISYENGAFRIRTDKSMGSVRTSFKWYIDGKYLNGYDNQEELIFYSDNNKQHRICMDEFFCNDTTPYRYCMMSGDSIQAPISGNIYMDTDKDCFFDSNEKKASLIPLKLTDDNGKFIAMTYSYNGEFSFYPDTGKYRLMLDLSNRPLQVYCSNPGTDTLIEIKSGQLIVNNLNFPVNCKPGFDIGVPFPLSRMTATPGRTFYINPYIGDLYTLYDSNCASNISGKIKISVRGKAHFTGVGNKAINPDSINGNDFIFLVNNFSTFKKDGISLRFKVDTLANIGDTVNVYISVGPDKEDVNPENNNVLLRVIIRNSYDPNMKEVYPLDVEPGFDDWFNYTVHFQNTGNSPAYTVRISDTLDRNLDASSFEFLNSSHNARVNIKDRAMVFYFADIMLPDSNSDEKNSHGFVQYRVKPLKNLQEGSKIQNTAYIFFDYNKPVVTNTTVNSFVRFPLSGIPEKEFALSFGLFPNPGSGLFTVLSTDLRSQDDASVEVFDMYGVLVYSVSYKTGGILLDLRSYADGLYICKLKAGETEIYRTLIKQ